MNYLETIRSSLPKPMPQLTLAALVLLQPTSGWASSHSDAPLIKQDPQANLTDVYAFVGTKYNDPTKKVLNVLVSVRPFSDPGDGVIFERFADDALYSIHITHPATGATLDRYDFQFSSVTGGLKNSNTILSYGLGTEVGPIQTIGDARQNYTQTYDVFKNGVLIGDDLPVPPPNVGARTTPAYNDPATGVALSGATTFSELDAYTQQAVRPLSGGQVVFAGPRDDGFFADTPAIFDLLDGRILADKDGDGSNGLGRDGGGVDGFKGFNVLSYAIQIDASSLTSQSYTDPFFGPSQGVGVYASVSRKRTRLLKGDGEPVHSGPWVQVNRLANPLFNEVLVALKDKDKYNRTTPPADAQFASYAENPELATLINVVFGTSFPATGRAELRAIYIPDVIRVNLATDPVKLPGQAGFSRLSLLGGDVAAGPGGVSASGGWPNGRRIGDDTVDIALTAVSALTLDLGDNVNANDQVYHQVFPYLATPHAGPTVTQRSAP